ncbi:MAG: redoxin domain-containing protein [Filomicrobium sp.]
MLKIFTLAFAAASMITTPLAATPRVAQTARLSDFSFTAIDGTALPLSAYAGKVVLLVNTASFCGFTRQYEGLQALWERYQSKGLVVIGVPSNDFNQEPDGEDEIAKFCQGAFGVTFPLTEKVSVKGSAAHPVYKWINSTLDGNGQPGWNFHKFLIGRDGKSVQSFSTVVNPSAPTLAGAIERKLAEGGN